VLHCNCASAVSAVVAVVSWGTLIVTASQLLQRLKKEYHLQSLFTVPAKVVALVLPSRVHTQQPETLVFFESVQNQANAAKPATAAPVRSTATVSNGVKSPNGAPTPTRRSVRLCTALQLPHPCLRVYRYVPACHHNVIECQVRSAGLPAEVLEPVPSPKRKVGSQRECSVCGRMLPISNCV